jgi:hypothetical protein
MEQKPRGRKRVGKGSKLEEEVVLTKEELQTKGKGRRRARVMDLVPALTSKV